MRDAAHTPQEASAHGDRLDSWKEIGEYLKRDVRTVQRWEQTRGLPVRRVPGGGHAAVHALKSELDVWLENRRRPTAELGPTRHGRFVLALATAAVLLASTGILWWVKQSRLPGDRPMLTRLTWDSGLTTDPALSPDGTLLAVASDRSGEGQLDIWVRQVAGRESVRLTDDPADDHEPVFSPDGSQIAFRSDRDPRGIYVLSALGGEPRLLAPHGRTPRYSPDGKWVAYWIGERHANSTIGIVPSAGGAVRQFELSDHKIVGAKYPVWSPDGHRLLFMALQEGPPDGVISDWWVISMDTGEPAPTGASDTFNRYGLPGAVLEVPSAWVADRILFSPVNQETASLWQVSISPKNLRIHGVPERLTFSTGFDSSPTIAANGHVAFASLAENIDVWSLAVDTTRPAPGGILSRLTDAQGADLHASISSDGRKMAFRSNRSGPWDLWSRDLETGRESLLVAGTATGGFTAMSSDGSKIAYEEATPSVWKGTYYVVERGSDGRPAPPRKVCEACGVLSDISDDGQLLLDYTGGPPHRTISSVSAASRKRFELTHHASYNLADPRFSPDGKWVGFQANLGPVRRQVFIFPARPGTTESDWIPITDGTALDQEIDWSPDGNVLYWISNRDGFRCLAARRLNPTTKRPLGEMFYVLHLHSARHSMMPFQNPNFGRPAVARDKIVFSLAARTGNIWMIKLPNFNGGGARLR